MADRAFEAWFLALADPALETTPPPPGGKGPANRVGGGPWALSRELCELADWHGVLPAVVRNLRRLDPPNPGVSAIVDEAQEQLRLRVGFSLLLRKQAQDAAAALAAAGIPALVLKGPEFADRLYAEPFLRPFTDLDFLLPRDALGDAGAALERLGYRRDPEPLSKYPGEYGEESWRLDDETTGTVELHWNLVNSPALRRRCSVRFHDLGLEPTEKSAAPRATAAALLLIAVIHAAASHRFDRLQPLCDVCQAARGAAGPVDAGWLAAAARRTGSAFAMATALRLAGDAFHEPACAALMDGAPCLAKAGRSWRWLITPRTVLHSRTAFAGLRRQLFRELLKRK